MLTWLIPLTVFSLFGISLTVGYIDDRRAAAQQDARRTYRAITQRAGVTACIPFASGQAYVNAPGLVEVHPASRTATHLQPPTPIAPPAAVPVAETSEQGISAISAAVKLPEKPISLAKQPTEEEGELIVSLWEESGLPMTKIITGVWGIKPGGSKAYVAARARYKHYLKELTEQC